MNVGTDDAPEWDELDVCLERPDDEGPVVVFFGNNFSTDLEDELPSERNVEFLGRHLARLSDLESSMRSDEALRKTMPSYEWDMIWRYHEALMTSMSGKKKKFQNEAGVPHCAYLRTC